ncbi:unnamed protein product [Aphanomyces euteiches]
MKSEHSNMLCRLLATLLKAARGRFGDENVGISAGEEDVQHGEEQQRANSLDCGKSKVCSGFHGQASSERESMGFPSCRRLQPLKQQYHADNTFFPFTRTSVLAMEESSQPKPLMTDLRCVKGIAVSSRFSEDGYNAFYNLDFKPDDIVALTFAKCGTTFLQKILYLLTRLDETGDFPPTYDSAKDTVALGQFYLDWMHRDKGHGPYPDNTIDDIVNQPSPRIFSTHLRPEMVPPHVADKARVVYMLRNPKDTFVSFHHMVAKMRGGVQGGWLGTPEHQGTYSYYMERSYFEHLKAMQTFIDEQANGRVLVLYYEDVVTNVRDNVRKLAAYLNVPLSDAKLDAIVTKSSFSNMQAAAPEHRQMLFRKGGNGDWKNYIDTVDKDGMPTPSAEQWQRFDDELAKLKDLPLAQPLFQWMN